MGLSSSGAVPREKLYLVNRWVDLALVGGVSLALFAFMRAFHTAERTPAVYTTAAWLAWVGNWPHFSATNYRLYRARENIRSYPVTAAVLPVLMAVAVAGSFLSPLRWAPLFVKVFTIWSPYHFSGQTLGITLLYARRAGIWVKGWERRVLSTLIFSTFLSQSLLGETGLESMEYYTIHYPSLHVPMWLAHASAFVMYAAVIGFGAVLWSWRKSSGRLVPAVVVLPVVAQFTWFIFGASWQSFQEFVPFFHSMQYLLIAWSMQRREAGTQGSIRWAAINVVGGATLFYFLPHALAFVLARPVPFSIGVTIAAVQIHHFFVDGVIWKLKSRAGAGRLAGSGGEPSSGSSAPAVVSEPAAAVAA